MHTITYVSSAKALFSDEALLRLLAASRDNNNRFNITGMLLYKSGSFIQSIEGPEQEIRQLYQNIQSDETHHHVITLIDEPLAARSFPDWSMGFSNISGGDYLSISGYTNFLNDFQLPDNFYQIQSHAKYLLGTFKEKSR